MDTLSQILDSPGPLNFRQWVDYSTKVSYSPFATELTIFERYLYGITEDEVDDIWTSFQEDEYLQFRHEYEDAFLDCSDSDERIPRIDPLVTETRLQFPLFMDERFMYEGMLSLSTLWFDFYAHIFYMPTYRIRSPRGTFNHPFWIYSWRFTRHREICGWACHMRRIRQVLRETVKKEMSLELRAYCALPEGTPRFPYCRLLEDHIRRRLEFHTVTQSLAAFWVDMGCPLNVQAYAPGY